MKQTHTIQVLDYLRKQPTEVHYSEVAAGTGLDHTQVFSSVAHLRRAGHAINSPLKGWYEYVSGPDEQLALDEMTAVGDDGTVVSILRDGRLLVSIAGRLYVASELDVDV